MGLFKAWATCLLADLQQTFVFFKFRRFSLLGLTVHPGHKLALAIFPLSLSSILWSRICPSTLWELFRPCDLPMEHNEKASSEPRPGGACYLPCALKKQAQAGLLETLRSCGPELGHCIQGLLGPATLPAPAPARAELTDNACSLLYATGLCIFASFSHTEL